MKIVRYRVRSTYGDGHDLGHHDTGWLTRETDALVKANRSPVDMPTRLNTVLLENNEVEDEYGTLYELERVEFQLTTEEKARLLGIPFD